MNDQETEGGSERTRRCGLINRSALKAFILQRLKEKRYHTFTRVSKSALDHYEACISNLLNGWPDRSVSKLAEPSMPSLLYWNKVRRLALDAAKHEFAGVLDIRGVGDKLLTYYEIMLKVWVTRDIERMPSKGKTFYAD